MVLCEDDPSCDNTYNAVMPLSHASTRERYSRIVGVTLFAGDDERGGGELSGPVASTPIARK